MLKTGDRVIINAVVTQDQLNPSDFVNVQTKDGLISSFSELVLEVEKEEIVKENKADKVLTALRKSGVQNDLLEYAIINILA